MVRVESARERRRNVHRSLGLVRRQLADEGWEHVLRDRGAFPTREVLIEENRALRAEVQRQAAVIEVQEKVIAELRDALGCEVIQLDATEGPSRRGGAIDCG